MIVYVPVAFLFLFDFIDILTLFVVTFITGGYLIAGQLRLKEVNREWGLQANGKVMIFFALTYFIFSGPFILEIIENIIQGTYFEFAYLLAVDRYAGEAEEGIIKKVSTILFFAYCSAFGSSFNELSKKHWIFLIIMILVESSSLSRAGVLLGVSIVAIEIIMIKKNYFKTAKLFIWGNLIIKITLILIPIFIFSAYFRLTATDDVIPILIDKFLSYSVAMYFAFSHWLSDANLFSAGLGYNTLSTFYKIFGIEYSQGHYTALLNTPFGETNIYTILRGLIEDFTVIGAMFFFLISGVAFKKFDSNPSIYNYMIARFLGLMILYFFYSPFFFTTVFFGYHLPLVFKFIEVSIGRIK